jgi:succinate dehydrogenase / fumarate reductase, cytochrome b subunit
MSTERKIQKNKLGLKGWVFAGRFGLERYAYTLHRISGLAILLYFILHIFVTGSRLGGQQAWEATMHLLETPLFKFGEFLLFIAVAYHALNGIRLVFVELGMLMGKPQRPIFPYVNAVRRQRPLLIIVMIVAAIIVILGGADFYLL